LRHASGYWRKWDPIHRHSHHYCWRRFLQQIIIVLCDSSRGQHTHTVWRHAKRWHAAGTWFHVVVIIVTVAASQRRCASTARLP
jgi:hypothetical protein